MANYIKNRWYSDSAERSWQEIAGALATNAWRIAKDKAITLHGERFLYHNDQERMWVMAEYLYFQVHVIDRIVYQSLSEEDRTALMVQLVSKLANFIQDNDVELFGPAEYGQPFIDSMRKRNVEYAEFKFTTAGPSYAAMRHLGYHIQQIMGEQDVNRWVIDQVMDKDGLEVYKQIVQTLHGLIVDSPTKHGNQHLH